MKTQTNVNQIIEMLNEYDVHTTDNTNEAIYILEDGTLIDGQFEYGARCVDHREIFESVLNIDRYHDNFWNEGFEQLNCIMLVPESQTIITHPNVEITDAQQSVINELDYFTEEFK